MKARQRREWRGSLRRHLFRLSLAAEIRREAFDEDFGQESWRSAAEQAEIADLRLTSDSRALDVACGAGGP
jgi:hypothetical protein